MSGVIVDGVQYEHCGVCREFENIRLMSYEQPSAEYQYGRDLCRKCVRAAVDRNVQKQFKIYGGKGQVYWTLKARRHLITEQVLHTIRLR